MTRSFVHLSLEERRTLYHLLHAKASISEIARIMGRHRSTIYR
ncbi:helix-turn-helix domain-containing protein [Aestuariibius insulae]